MTDRTQAIALRRNLLNIIRELEADSARCLKHAEALRHSVDEIERENQLGKYSYDALSVGILPVARTYKIE